MRAFEVQQQKNGGSTLVEVEKPVPVPKPNEVIMSIRAAGVTPTELQWWYTTSHNADGSARQGAVPGHEFSGVVTALGENVSRFQVGSEVFGMSSGFEDGATAQYCAAVEDGLILKPASLSHIAAAAIPISGLTAWQGLVDRAKVKRDDRVLIVGASGSVGLMAVQIAALHGCTVFGSAPARAESALKALGCHVVLDYKSQPFEQHLKAIEVVFDTVGGDTLARAEKILVPGGRMVTVAADAEGSNDPLIKAAYFIVEGSSTALQKIVELIEQGKLHPFIKSVLPLAEAANVYANKVHAPSLGKLVLEIGCAIKTERLRSAR